MNNKLLIRDLTLRDGQQSLFATRLSQEQIDRVLPYYKDAHFYAMEVWGGAVPDSIMRYLNEDPWERLQKIHEQVGDVSLLTALSRGRNLFGYAPYPDDVIDGFCRLAIGSGLNVMRIFDALNDIDNVKSTITSVKKYGGIADCAVCYTVDPHFTTKERAMAMLKGKPLPKAVFTDEYFINKVKQLEKLGADMISLKDMAGLVTPSRAGRLIRAMKENTKIPVDFHTHCTPGYGLASVFMAIVNGVDIVDTNIWYFSGGPAAPAIELVDLFCKKAGIAMDVDMTAVRKINEKLLEIRKELADFDAVPQIQKPFDYDHVPAEIDTLMQQALDAAKKDKEDELLAICRKIEDYYGYPQPNEIVREAEIPGGMYSNMLAQLKAVKSEEILDDAMKLIPRVRLDAGLPPLVTPTSQIVGAQAVSCALSLHKGKDMYAVVSKNFEDLVKGQYGHTPVAISPAFRKQITGNEKEIAYDMAQYKEQPNPTLEEFGGVALVQNEEEKLLLELFPNVAKDFLMKLRKSEYEAKKAVENQQNKEVAKTQEKPQATHMPFIGETVVAPLPGKVLSINVKPGDVVKAGQTLLVLEAMKMENDIRSLYGGTIRQVLVKPEECVTGECVLLEMEPA
ncbi:MAG: biotin/lipoyl-containing protein [Bacteroidales bacterium]